jgi:hypothetical protein
VYNHTKRPAGPDPDRRLDIEIARDELRILHDAMELHRHIGVNDDDLLDE